MRLVVLSIDPRRLPDAVQGMTFDTSAFSPGFRFENAAAMQLHLQTTLVREWFRSIKDRPIPDNEEEEQQRRAILKYVANQGGLNAYVKHCKEALVKAWEVAFQTYSEAFDAYEASLLLPKPVASATTAAPTGTMGAETQAARSGTSTVSPEAKTAPLGQRTAPALHHIRVRLFMYIFVRCCCRVRMNVLRPRQS